MVHEHFVCDTYKCNVLLYAGCHCEDVFENLEQDYNVVIDESWHDCKGVTFFNNSKDGTIYYGIWIKTKSDHSSFVHELLHLVYHILNYREIKVSIGNEETVAYYLAYWYEKMIPYMRRNRKKNKSRRKK